LVTGLKRKTPLLRADWKILSAVWMSQQNACVSQWSTPLCSGENGCDLSGQWLSGGMNASSGQRCMKGESLIGRGFFLFLGFILNLPSGDSKSPALMLFSKQASQRARQSIRLFALYYYIIR
jgi:hypothetical protein